MDDSQNRRLGQRVSGHKEVFGLMTVDGGDQQHMSIWDISTSGLGVQMDTAVTEGTKVILTFSQPFLAVLVAKVVWCERREEHPGYRAGLYVREQRHVLDSLLMEINSETVPLSS